MIPKSKDKEIALERVKTLFKEADSVFKKNPERANRYVELARKISMKVNLRIPKELKRRFCKHCNCYLKPGVNCRVRTKNKKVVYYCKNCKKFMRFVIPKKYKEPEMKFNSGTMSYEPQLPVKKKN